MIVKILLLRTILRMLPFDHDWLCREPDDAIRMTGPGPAALLAGSFNPLHDGHRLLADAAARRLGMPVAFELSMRNVDKPELAEEEVRRRLEQFHGIAPVYVTRAMTFERKAVLFPGTVMVVGYDTAERIIAPRYYGNDVAIRDHSLAAVAVTGSRFLVAGRLSANGYLTIDHLDVPTAFRDLFIGLSEAEFRSDLSSTMLRTGRC